MMSYVLLLFASLSLSPEIGACDSEQSIWKAIRVIDKGSQNFTVENGINIDNRSDIFKQFQQQCLIKYLKSATKQGNKKQAHLLLSSVRKSYFYTHEKALIKHYINYLNQFKTPYQQGLDYANAVLESRKIEPKFIEQGAKQGKEYFIDHSLNITQLNKDNALVIVSSPYCGFSQKLQTWFKQQPFDFSDTQVVWLYKPPEVFSLDKFYATKSHQTFKTVLGKEYWHSVYKWDTPVVYFYQNGKLTQQVVGWNEQMKAFFTQFKKEK